MFKNNYISEIELNTCNLCNASCIICSEPHGCDNDRYMEPEVFYTLLKQLKDVETNIIQTSGLGETFMNPHFLEYVHELHKAFPKTPKWIYNNFSIFTPDLINTVLNNKYFEKIHTRIDSLDSYIFQMSSNLRYSEVFENLDYFLSVNETTPLVILYNNIKDYYNRCKSVTGKRPIRDRFTDADLENVPDEQQAITNYVKSKAKRPELVTVCRINHGLWGERYRNDIQHNPDYPCPKIEVIKKVCWIYPNGDIGMCCYEDRQSPEFSLGNITIEHILDIFYGEKRKKAIENIKNNVYRIYPCNNPRLCGFGDGVESK